MSEQGAVYQWSARIARQFPHLRASQAKVLAAFSWGVVASRRCTLRRVAEALGHWGKPDTVERRLQRFVANPRVDWQAGATALAAWIVARLGSRAVIVLLVDETSLQEHLKAMVVSIAYRGRALPVAWWCYRPAAWPMGQVGLIMHLLDQLAPVFPPQSQILVQADRGLGTSPALLEAIAQRGWYFLVRVQRRVHVQVGGQEVEIGALVPAPGKRWHGAVEVFKNAGWRSYWVVGQWRRRAAQPWLLLTNWPQAQAAWYGIRMWEEAAFKDLKSSGWHWQRSHVRRPAHANRLWLVLALASAWMSSLGTHVVRSRVLRRELTRGHRWQYSVLQLGLRLFARRLALGRPLWTDFAFVPHLPLLPKTVVP